MVYREVKAYLGPKEITELVREILQSYQDDLETNDDAQGALGIPLEKVKTLFDDVVLYTQNM